jgi:hypothetical protein
MCKLLIEYRNFNRIFITFAEHVPTYLFPSSYCDNEHYILVLILIY